MRKRVRVGRVISVADEIARVEFGLVFQDGRLELAEFLEDEVALLSTSQFDAVDCAAGFDGGMVKGVKGAVEEGVEQG